MKPIVTSIALLFTSFALLSCGSKDAGSAAEADSGSAEAIADSHDEIADIVVGEMTSMMNGMSAIKDVASAEAFAETVPAIKSKMRECLAAAKSLPAPTEEEKAAFKAKMEAAQEQAGPAMMAMMMGMSQNPDAEAIGKVMEGAMDDDEMDTAMNELAGIYAIEEQAAGAPEPVE